MLDLFNVIKDFEYMLCYYFSFGYLLIFCSRISLFTIVSHYFSLFILREYAYVPIFKINATST